MAFSDETRMGAYRGAQRSVAIVPSNSTVIPATRGVYVGSSGHLHCTMEDGSECTFVSIAAGVIHPISVIKVFTDSTAGSLLALY